MKKTKRQIWVYTDYLLDVDLGRHEYHSRSHEFWTQVKVGDLVLVEKIDRKLGAITFRRTKKMN